MPESARLRLAEIVALESDRDTAVAISLVLISGGIKFYINVFRGRLGERMLRRLRFELSDGETVFSSGRCRLRAGVGRRERPAGAEAHP